MLNGSLPQGASNTAASIYCAVFYKRGHSFKFFHCEFSKHKLHLHPDCVYFLRRVKTQTPGKEIPHIHSVFYLGCSERKCLTVFLEYLCPDRTYSHSSYLRIVWTCDEKPESDEAVRTKTHTFVHTHLDSKRIIQLLGSQFNFTINDNKVFED